MLLQWEKVNITIPSEAPLRDHHYSLLENITSPIEWDKENSVNPSRGLPFPSREKHYALEWGMLLFLTKGNTTMPSRGEDHTLLIEYLYPLKGDITVPLQWNKGNSTISVRVILLLIPKGKQLSPSRGILLLPL